MKVVGSSPVFNNNTVAFNRTMNSGPSAVGGGIHAWDDYASISGVNNIVYYNQADADPEAYGNIDFTYTCISTGLSGIGNITDDPMFTDTTSRDLTLQEYSPCIDTGDPNSPLDPDGTRADMGAYYFNQSSVIITNPTQGTPSEFVLLPNYPNPFNPKTRLTFSIPIVSQVRLVIFDITGRQVDTIMERWLPAGTYQTIWDAGGFPSGTYYARFTADDFHQTRKLLLIK
jgi:hypothetical protein